MESRLISSNSTSFSTDRKPQGFYNEDSHNLMQHKIASSSSKRSKRAAMKRVLSIPIKEVGNARGKQAGDGAPPADCWAWRKYGQKPIKGSPYPRGYYRCSSSKGCPARKQVERSHVDPTMLLITYSSEHNHTLPAAPRSHHQSNNTTTKAQQQPLIKKAENSDSKSDKSTMTTLSESLDQAEQEEMPEESRKLLTTLEDEFEWLTGLDSATTTTPSFMMMEGAMFGDDLAGLPILGEEDELLFADLGELPECSAEFRRREEEDEERIRCHNDDVKWFGTT